MGLLDSYLNNAADQDGSPVNRWENLAVCIHAVLEEIRDGIVRNSEAGKIDPLDAPFVIQTDGGGNGSYELFLRPGVAWELRSYAYQLAAGAAASGYLAFYRDQEVGSNLYKTGAIATIQDNAFTQGQFVPDQSRLLIVVRGGPVNSSVSGRVFATATVFGTPTETTHA